MANSVLDEKHFHDETKLIATWKRAFGRMARFARTAAA